VDGGAFDLASVWLNGNDIGTSLAEFNGYLVVFGKRSVIIYSNPWTPASGGSSDPSVMTLVENIGGVGCIARDSVQHVGTDNDADVVFLSFEGLRSLGRTIQEKSMPMQTISKNVNDELVHNVSSETLANIKSGYLGEDGFYILSLPVSDISYYFDLRSPLPDGTFRVTKWTKSFSSFLTTSSGAIFFGKSGYVDTYTGYLDDVLSDGTGGTSFDMHFLSGWNDLSQVSPELAPLLKLPKKANFLILGGSGQTSIIKWAFDFIDTFNSFSTTVPSAGVAEWGIAEYNIDEWSGGYVYNNIKAPFTKAGQVIKFGFTTTIYGDQVALQHFAMQLKTGRIA
jgi:hypothetical protein